MLNEWLFLICYNIKAEDLIDEMRDSILKTYHSNYQGGLLCKSAFYVIMDLKG